MRHTRPARASIITSAKAFHDISNINIKSDRRRSKRRRPWRIHDLYAYISIESIVVIPDLVITNAIVKCTNKWIKPPCPPGTWGNRKDMQLPVSGRIVERIQQARWFWLESSHDLDRVMWMRLNRHLVLDSRFWEYHMASSVREAYK